MGLPARHSSGFEEMTAMMFGYGGMGGGWPVWAVALTWIGMLAFLGVLIWVGYMLMTNATRRSHQPRRSGAHARGILDERLARGEIDAAEYQRLQGLIAASDDQAPAGAASGR
jgi:putative membrane protein